MIAENLRQDELVFAVFQADNRINTWYVAKDCPADKLFVPVIKRPDKRKEVFEIRRELLHRTYQKANDHLNSLQQR